MSIAVVHSLPEPVWHYFVDEHPAGNIFHTPEMFRVFSRTRGYKPTLWAAIDGHKHPLALMVPVEVTLVRGMLYRFTTRAIVHSSVLCVPGSKGREALSLLLESYKQDMQGRILFTELRNLSDLSDLQSVLAENGFVYEKHLNYLINLNQPVEEVLQNIGKRTRKKIRKGLRGGSVEIAEVTKKFELDRWYSTLQQTYSNAHVPLADRSLFEATFDELRAKSMAKFLLARVDGATAACSVELTYKDTIYGWYGGSDRYYSKYLPNEMLMWHILKWGAENSYRLYDFGGAGKPDEEYGVRDFKAKFGGELVDFGRYTCIHSPNRLRLSRLGYQLIRRMW